jgi:hypothetical protein
LVVKDQCTIPPTMTMAPGQNIMVEYPSGHAAVFDQHTMHAGGIYTKDQCNIDIRRDSCKIRKIVKGSTISCPRCTYSNSQLNTHCELCETKLPEFYNVRLHLEVDTSGTRPRQLGNQEGFSASKCTFMHPLIAEFEVRAQPKPLFLANVLPNEEVLQLSKLTIFNHDADRIFHWLNDTLIEFIVESSEYVMKNEKIKYFSSLFFAKLKEGPPDEVTIKGKTTKTPKPLPGSEIDYDKVRRWIKDKSYLDKELILFPINEKNSHWYLVSFIQPKLLFQVRSEQQPFVVVLDSILDDDKTKYHNTVEALKTFLCQSWLEEREKMKETAEDAPKLTEDALKVKLVLLPTVFPESPQQPNNIDCGVHLAKHAKNIARKFQHLKLKKNEEGDFVLDYNLCEDLTQDVSSERKYLMNQLVKLIEDSPKWASQSHPRKLR